MVADQYGGCRCGDVQYRVAGDDLPNSYACHCLDCQTWSGSAFSLNAIVDERAFSLSGAVAQFDLASSDGERISHQFACARCFTRIYNTNSSRPGLVVIRAGTFDNSHHLRIVAHIWTKRMQPGLIIPAGVPSWPQGAPKDQFFSLLNLARSGN